MAVIQIKQHDYIGNTGPKPWNEAIVPGQTVLQYPFVPPTMLNGWRSVALIAVLGWQCLANGAPGTRDDRVVKEVLAVAAASPPEFYADALLRIGPDPREASEQAFVLAFRAQRKTPLLLAVHSKEPSREAMKALASAAGLDQLSLQMRAVRKMLAVDPDRAREMFGAVRPEVAAASCGDALVGDAREFYATAAVVIRREDVFLASQMIDEIESPVEVAPAAAWLADAPFAPEEREELAARFGQALERVSDDDRSFAHSWHAADEAVRTKLIPRLVNGEALSRAYRRYVVRHLTGVRCAENIGPEPLAEQFDKSERTPSRVEPGAKLRPALPHAREIMERANAMGPDQPGVSIEEWMKSGAFTARLDAFVNYVRDLKPAAGQSESGVWFERAFAATGGRPRRMVSHDP